jgi:hypothetical protein
VRVGLSVLKGVLVLVGVLVGGEVMVKARVEVGVGVLVRVWVAVGVGVVLAVGVTDEDLWFWQLAAPSKTKQAIRGSTSLADMRVIIKLNFPLIRMGG